MEIYLSTMILKTVKEALKHTAPGEKDLDQIYKKAAFYLLDNSLFSLPHRQDSQKGEILVEEGGLLQERLETFLAHMEDSREEKVAFLMGKLREKFPETADRLAKFQWEELWRKDDSDMYELLDYLAAHLPEEVHLMDDKLLLSTAEDIMKRSTCNCAHAFADFACWEKACIRDTHYFIDLDIGSRGNRTATKPYSLENYANMFYLTFNEDYLAKKKVFPRACGDKELAHTETYISLHLVTGWRDSDLMRLPHPDLPDSPEEVLARISAGTFTDREARQVVRSMMVEMDRIPLSPNKNRRHKNIPALSFHISLNQEVHFGTLFAIDECFWRLDGDPEAPLFRPVKRLSVIRKTMGDEMADLFEGNNACPTAFSKTFMQILSIMGSRAGELDGPANALFCQRLAEMARSHKGGYASFSNSTFIYLRECAMGTLTPDMVVKECFQRGTLSFHLSRFLSLLTGREFEKLDYTSQTKMIKILGLTPLEAERAVEVYNKAMEEASDQFTRLLSYTDPDEQRKAVEKAINHLTTRMAPGKDMGALCFVSALEKDCLHPDYDSCLACPYRIDTRATLYHAVRELRRCKLLHERARTEGERRKYELIVMNHILPLIEQISLTAMKFSEDKDKDAVDEIIAQAMGEEFEEDEEDEDETENEDEAGNEDEENEGGAQ